ncbi:MULTISPECIES: flagellar filament capping protein FliD [Marinobacter]|jgi:flagellar hook-associated protein 2|uniref:Flagellar hook-associated protein 2 n=1 Tax=Marinobacter salarius TaxID=1420917 RepID=A0A1W6K832_9GAMM|nr:MULTISPECIES: flagellar filament capping protein FliD [Marinobacter]ARM83561.1 flagellar hook-associated protein 2 [Marinobacter salarius]MAB54106.1 flagellar cap protein FliD [Marinobacter sp.]MBS8230220.1 flagellar cap protein FliD [Marinobacter salarius]MCZ4285675.1 flagellar filament capping protein FliD [Marinobacter salarius]MDC8456112.1 flagellar filament capping protein FliD [Marinobacter sp. DS40M6]|tara:strand:+ start:1016 stop:3007 length:1992 start_codon:yes stop_codon:yes gene_type:complete
MANISSLGIGSGVLTSELVDQLVQAERAPTENRLAQKTERTQALISAYGTLRSAVTELRLPMRQLSAPDNLKAFSATSSNEDVAVSVDSSKANRGTYSVDVTSLASAQALASRDVFADRDKTSVGQGTMTLSVGDNTTNIVIDSSNDTLQGLANAINDSDAGVSAGVIDTGSGFQLVLSADETGTANAVSISVSGDSAGTDTDAQGLSRFAFNTSMDAGAGLNETIAASDAVMSINGVEVTRSTNSFENVIDGLTFDLTATGTSTVKVEQDLGAVADRVQGFVEKFNGLQETIDALAGFNAESGSGSLLTGDSVIRGIQNQLRQVLTRVVPGLEDASVRSLADVGITTNFETGSLEFDREEFMAQLKANPDDVTALFAEQGRATDSQVEFVRSGVNTEPGTYDINVTQAATQGTLAGNAAATFPVTIDGTNDEFSLLVNGDTSVNLQLTQQTYNSAQDLVDEIQAQLNSNNALNASDGSVQVSLGAGDELVFSSSTYGSESSVTLSSAESAATFGLDAATSTDGLDVAGTIDGRTAEGEGQTLFLGENSGAASGLQVQILGDQTGSRGSIQFIEGVGERTVDLITNFVGADGAIDTRTESLNRDLERIQENQIRLEERITAYRERLVSQFTAADSLISQLNSTQDFVSQQLAALAPQNNRNNN